MSRQITGVSPLVMFELGLLSKSLILWMKDDHKLVTEKEEILYRYPLKDWLYLEDRLMMVRQAHHKWE
jgi:hypothetical protein